METSLSIEELRAICETVGNEAEVRAKPSLAPVLVATRVVQHFLGSAWLKNAMNPTLPQGDVLRPRFEADDQPASHLVYLAESLLNLQTVEGFAGLIERARFVKVGAGLDALHVAQLLFAAGTDFRFFAPKGIWGHDYSLEIVYPDGLVAPGETTATLKSGELSASNILRGLEKGRPQLPEGGAGIMFLMVPRAWFSSQQRKYAERTMADAAIEFFRGTRKRRGTKRVMSVKYYADPLTREAGVTAPAVHEVSNAYNPAYPNRHWDLFGAQSAAPRAWVRLSDFVGTR